MRILLLLIVSLTAAFGIGIFLEEDAGRVILSYAGVSVQTSFVLFAVLMFLNTPHGDTFTFSQFTEYLLSAGFTNIRRLDLSLETSVVIGEKDDHMK